MSNTITFQIPGGTPVFNQYIPSDAVLGSATLVDSNRLTSVLATGSVKESLIQDGVSAGVLTIAKTGSTARTVTFPDAAITVARSDAAQTFTGLQTFATGITISGSNLTLNSGSRIVVDDTTDSTAITNGSIQTDGGLGVTKAAWIGGLMDVAGITTFHAAPVIDKGTGATGITAASGLSMWSADATSLAQITAVWGNSAGFSFTGYNMGGTRAAPSATPSGSAFITFSVRGYDTAITGTAGSFNCETGSLWASGNRETNWVWKGVANSSTANTEWMRLDEGALITRYGRAAGVTSTATAAGTTTLVATSTEVQIFTGTTTQSVQFPAANLFGAGVAVKYTIKNYSTGNLTILRAGSDTFEGATTDVLSNGTCVRYASDGVSLWVKC